MASELLEIDGVSLRGQGFGVATRSGRYSMPSRRGDNYVLPGRSGSAFVKNKPYDEGMGALSVWAVGALTAETILATNLATNPSFSGTSGTAVVQQGLQGYGGSAATANAASPPLIDLDYLGAQGWMNVPATACGASSPTSTNLDVTDLDVRAYVSFRDWTPSTSETVLGWAIFVGRWTLGNQKSWSMSISGTGVPRLSFSLDGSTNLAVDATASVSFVDGGWGHVRITRVASTGAVNFYTSSDGLTWTALGAQVMGTAGSLFAGTSSLWVGHHSYFGGSWHAVHRVGKVQVYNGINGTLAADFNADDFADKAVAGATATDSTGKVWTLTGTGTKVHTRKVLWTPGAVNNYATSDPFRIAGDLDVRVKAALSDWTPGTTQVLALNYASGSAGSGQFSFYIPSTGRPTFSWTLSDGTTGASAAATVSPTVADGAPLWVRATLDVDNGAAGRDIKFYTSPDGVVWTQLGSTVTQAGATSLNPVAAPLSVGGNAGGNVFKGVVLHAEVRDGIDGPVVARFRPEEFAAPGVQNFVSNPSFEAGMTGWTSESQVTVSITGDDKYRGTQCAKMVVGVAGGGSLIQLVTGLVVGRTYTVSAWGKNITGSGFGLSCGGVSSSNAAASWARASVTFTATATSHNMYLFTAQGVVGHSCYIDDVMLEEGATATDFDITNPAIPAARKRVNLITNPSAEVDATGWQVQTNNTVVRSTAQAWHGTASLLWTLPNDGTTNHWIRIPVTTVVGQRYRGAVRVRPSVQMTLRLAASATLLAGVQVVCPANVWTTINDGGTASVVADALYVQSIGDVAAGQIVHVDGVQLEQVESGNLSYFDGSTTPASKGQTIRWTGTAHASTSELLDEYVVSQTNLITNPNFEVNTAGWGTANGPNGGGPSATGGTLTRDTTRAYTGTASAKIVGTAVRHGSNVHIGPVFSGETYTFSAYVYVESLAAGTQVGLYMNVYDGTSYTFYDATPAEWTSTVGSWVRLSRTITLNRSGYLSFAVSQNGASGTWNFDAVQVEKVATLSTYYDGSTANDGTYEYRWAGTANASASEKLVRATKTWNLTRSGDATAELIDRNTFAFTGTELMVMPHREELSAAGDAALYAHAFTRSVSGATFAIKGIQNSAGAGNQPGYSLVMTGSGVTRWDQRAAGAYQSSPSTLPPANDGVWRGHYGHRSGSTALARNTGSVSATAAVNSDTLASSENFQIGRTGPSATYLKGHQSAVAFFRRALTVAEQDALVAWNGKVATEPAWLRDAATLYVNADDPYSRMIYRTYNYVVNLAEGFTGSSTYSSINLLDTNNLTPTGAGVGTFATYTPYLVGTFDGYHRFDADGTFLKRFYTPFTTLQSGHYYTGSIEVRCPEESESSVTVTLDLADATPATVVVLAPGETEIVSVTAKKNFDDTYRFLDVNVAGSDGSLVDLKDPYVEYGQKVRRIPNDFTYGWSGTTFQSIPERRAPALLSTTAYSSVAYQSAGRLAVRPAFGTNTDTYVTPGNGDSGAIRLGMQAGKTYTASATVTTPEVQTGSLSPRARRIVVFINVNGAYEEFTSAAGPITGSERLSVTFTIPPNATEAFIRLYNGAAGSTGLPYPANVVYWDDYIVTEGTVSPPFFDGSTIDDSENDYRWTGSVNNSSSQRVALGNLVVPVTRQAQRQAFEDNMNKVMRLFTRGHRLSTIRAAQPDGSVRRALVEWREWSEPEVQAGGTRAEWAIAYTIPSVWWEDETVTVQSGSGTLDLTSFAGMTGIIEDAVITVTGASTAPKITDAESGAWVQYTGNLSAGQQWVIDVGAATSKVGGTSVLTNTIHVGNYKLLVIPNCFGAADIPRLVLSGGGTISVSARRKWING